MVLEDHYRKLERMYQFHPLNNVYQAKIIISEGFSEVTMPVTPSLHHAAKAVHGAVYFKALDDATYFACNSVVT